MHWKGGTRNATSHTKTISVPSRQKICLQSRGTTVNCPCMCNALDPWKIVSRSNEASAEIRHPPKVQISGFAALALELWWQGRDRKTFTWALQSYDNNNIPFLKNYRVEKNVLGIKTATFSFEAFRGHKKVVALLAFNIWSQHEDTLLLLFF